MFDDLRQSLAACMRRLYRKGLTTTSGGNLSVRAGDGHLLLTPSKLDKGTLRADQILIMTWDGENLTPELVPSIEAGMHRAVYAACPRVRAIVHAHPSWATAFCAAGTPINVHLTAEAYAILGEPAWADYALMGTPDLAGAVAAACRRACCVLMENHGVLTTGTTILEAFDRMEVLEEAARMTVITRALGSVRELSPERLAALDAFMGRSPGLVDRAGGPDEGAFP